MNCSRCLARPRTPSSDPPRSVSLFVHEFAKDILVMWTGFPLSAASREKKTVLKKDMGAVNYKEEMDFLKQKKAGRKKMYEEWKGLQ